MHFDSPWELWLRQLISPDGDQGRRQMGWPGPSPIQGFWNITILIQVHLVASQRDAGGVFSSLSPKPSVMRNPRRVNLQPAVVSRSLSTKEGNKAVGEGGSWTWWVERGGVDAQYRQQTSVRFQGTGRRWQLWCRSYYSPTMNSILFRRCSSRRIQTCPDALQKENELQACWGCNFWLR